MSHRLTLAACLAGAFLLSPQSASAQETFVVEGEEHCVVNVATWDRLNVRDEPSSSGEIVTRHRYGDCGIIVVGEPEGGWYPIEDGHFDGWVNSKYISMVSPALYCVTGVADDDVLNLRAYPAAISRIIAELEPSQCDIAFLPYAVAGWQKVRVDGYEGWIKAEFVSGQ
ncbi:MAG: SH3 domain-containing protein [Devosia sp.]|nr:SH3 domain-containing protein [Devosia sp.]